MWDTKIYSAIILFTNKSYLNILKQIGVVTVNYRSLDYTLQFVQSVGKTLDNYLLVIVNNSPEDADKLKKLKNKNVVIINSKGNIGYSGGLNSGMKYIIENTKIDWLLIGNNDVIITSEFVEKLPKLSDQNTIYSPVIMNVEDDIVQNTGGNVGIIYGGTININKGKLISEIKKVQPDFLSGCFLYFHKSILDKVGYFDEEYESYFEDVDFSMRARKKGVKLEIVWDWLLRHYHSMSTKHNSGEKDYLIARNAIYFAKKDLTSLKKYVFILSSIVIGFFWVLPRPKNLPFYFKGVISGLL